MHASDAYDSFNEYGDELPELPIPRPGERAAARPEQAAPIAAPALGGGASFTSVDPDAPRDCVDAAPEPRSDRFTWELAARLTAGMLANPSRANSSVKDAMGVFDQFVQEMHAYLRIAGFVDTVADSSSRRSAFEAYFHAPREQEVEARSTQPLPDAAGPIVAAPEPALPRPAGDYRPIPPGARYVPGSMAGPPPSDVDRDEDAPAA